VLIQVADVVLPNLGAPAWLIQALIYASAVGFPVALILAWFYELTPEGIKTTADADAVDAVRFSGRKIDFAIIGLLVLAVGVLLVRSPLEEQAPALPNSVAVLPFDNLSPDPENEFFAAGIHDTILNELAKIADMNVIARTSVLRYADGQTSISEIAAELNVETVMEGTVQYADDQVRITAQLIDPETGAHLWSDNYDREFEDIFAIQSDVAINVANALEAEFSLREQASIGSRPTESLEAYVFYLRALASDRAQWRGLIDRAIELDSEFALAHARKAYGVAISLVLDSRRSPIIVESAQRALELDPELGLAHAAFALLHQAHARWDEAREASELALEFSPNDPAVLYSYGVLERYLGDYERSIELGRRAVDLNPNSSLYHYQLGISYRYAEEYEAAYEAFRIAAELAPRTFSRHMQLGFAEIMRGNDDAALSNLQRAEELSQQAGTPSYRLAQFAFGYRYLDQPEDAQRFFDQISETDPSNPVPESVWAMAYIAIRDYDTAHEWLEMAVDDQANNAAALGELRSNSFQDRALDESRFRELRDKIGT
jgi:TolB-like protein/Flp pilus assembly protein TadD